MSLPVQQGCAVRKLQGRQSLHIFRTPTLPTHQKLDITPMVLLVDDNLYLLVRHTIGIDNGTRVRRFVIRETARVVGKVWLEQAAMEGNTGVQASRWYVEVVNTVCRVGMCHCIQPVKSRHEFCSMGLTHGLVIVLAVQCRQVRAIPYSVHVLGPLSFIGRICLSNLRSGECVGSILCKVMDVENDITGASLRGVHQKR